MARFVVGGINNHNLWNDGHTVNTGGAIMAKFKVYTIEEMENSYIVEAESKADAEEKTLGGDFDAKTQEIVDIYNYKIVYVEEVIDA